MTVLTFHFYQTTMIRGDSMSRKRKLRAYLQKEITGHWLCDPITHWVARDEWTKNAIAYGRTRKECEQKCRDKGYVPERG